MQGIVTSRLRHKLHGLWQLLVTAALHAVQRHSPQATAPCLPAFSRHALWLNGKEVGQLMASTLTSCFKCLVSPNLGLVGEEGCSANQCHSTRIVQRPNHGNSTLMRTCMLPDAVLYILVLNVQQCEYDGSELVLVLKDLAATNP